MNLVHDTGTPVRFEAREGQIQPAMEIVHQENEARLGKRAFWHCISSCTPVLTALWGSVQWPTQASDTVSLTLYKDLTGSSLSALLRLVEGEHHLSRASWFHNIHAARRAIRDWAQALISPDITLRGLTSRSVASNLALPPGVDQVHVWVDSVDFKRIQSQDEGHQGPGWSYKEGATARRYLVFSDAFQRVLRVLGPFSPKVSFHTHAPDCIGIMPQIYDGHQLLAHKAEVEDWFGGATIVGDQHFEWAAQHFERCRIVAPVAAHTGPLEESASLRHETRRKRTLTESERTWNEAVREIRARVEAPFASCKTLFRALEQKFWESEEQHDCLVRTAFAFHNLRLKNNT